MIDDINKLLLAANEESGGYVKTIDLPHIQQQLEALHSQGKLVCLLHHDSEGEPDGLYLGVVGNSWHSPEIVLNELILYVRTDKRKGSLALRLLRSAERQAKDMGATFSVGGVTLQIDKEKACGFYKACKYEEYGTTFRREL